MKHVNNLPYLQSLGLTPTPPPKKQNDLFFVTIAVILIAGIVVQQIQLSKKSGTIADFNRRLAETANQPTLSKMELDQDSLDT
ncbi:MAG: hypothetical protein EOO69_12795 [Moraxellaceae bacterium]|nr:MAG: hypothetical protein EOO69_12795 [Moraxellaceae bacterium]